MAVAAHNQEIGRCVRGMREERAGYIGLRGSDLLDLHLRAMAGKMVSDIGGQRDARGGAGGRTPFDWATVETVMWACTAMSLLVGDLGEPGL